jgi:hypothetical protein
VVSRAPAPACVKAVEDVFVRSGFIQVQSPPNVSMLFSPRTVGPYSSFLGTGVGVGVTIDRAGADACHVTLEALSADVNCAEEHAPLSCGGLGEVRTTAALGVGPPAGPGAIRPNHLADGPSLRCPMMPSMMCTFSYAPGAENDAAVDELARRLRAQLGPLAVN